CQFLDWSQGPRKDSKRLGFHLVPKLIGQKKVGGKRCNFATFLQVVAFTHGQCRPIQNLRRLP
ncbi:MAG TPA: hypothetical protein VF224_12875, partial [Aestuariivirga sp.]